LGSYWQRFAYADVCLVYDNGIWYTVAAELLCIHCQCGQLFTIHLTGLQMEPGQFFEQRKTRTSNKQYILTLKLNKMSRFKMGKVQPAAYKAMDALDKYLETSSIDKRHRELIKIRASQINGCAYCVNDHTGDALKLGEDPKRLYLVSVWKEAPNVFSEEEQLLFAITEEITLIHQHGLSEELYQKALALFGEEKTAQIIMAAITINAWNRIGVSLNMHPEL
jgi:AhpD family alkylhydroperoxidase